MAVRPMGTGSAWMAILLAMGCTGGSGIGEPAGTGGDDAPPPLELQEFEVRRNGGLGYALDENGDPVQYPAEPPSDEADRPHAPAP